MTFTNQNHEQVARQPNPFYAIIYVQYNAWGGVTMFGKSSKDIYINNETRPLSVSGSNDNPFMQEMLRGEEKRREKNRDDIHNRQNGYIK
jgi:hypothetical protein